MRRLTDEDLVGIVGQTIQGYRVEAAKIKQGPFIDSNHYDIILGKNTRDEYATWEFHLKDDESVPAYWSTSLWTGKKTFGIITPVGWMLSRGSM